MGSRTKHPYRDEELSNATANAAASDAFEEQLLAAVLMTLGALGILIGFAAPGDRATELTVGIFLFLLGGSTFHRQRARQIVRPRAPS